MAINFQCSHCQASLSTQEDNLGGSLLRCPTCSRMTRVPLVCPKCKARLESSTAAGGDRVRCGPCSNVFTVKLTTDEVDTQLDGLGGRVGQFRQGERSGALPDRDKALKERVSGGYCEGIALDWLRRVVQGGRPSYTPSPYSGSAARTPEQIAAREESQTRRGAQAWDQRYGGTRDTALAEQQRIFDENLKRVKEQGAADVKRIDEMRDRAEKAKDSAYQRYSGLVDAFNACTTGTQQLAVEPEMNAAEKAYKDAVAEFKRLNDEFVTVSGTATKRANEVFDARKAQVAKPQIERIWLQFTQAMDRIEAANRRGTGRDNTSRPFSGLQVRLSVPDSGYSNPSEFANAVVRCPALQPGNGVLIGFDAMKEKEPGHAVAAYRLNTSDYHFFDPNVGIYKVSERGLADALNLLFGKFYEGFTESNGSVKAGYTVFGHDGPVTPSVFKTGPASSAAQQREPEPIVLPAITLAMPARKPATAAAGQAPPSGPRPGATTGASTGASNAFKAARAMFDKK